MNKKPYLVTTAHRGVFAGLIDPDTIHERTLSLEQARCAIYWAGTAGFLGLASIGPAPGSRIGAPADLPVLHDVTSVAEMTAKAWAAWTND
jgi:hypothetical protein